MADLIREVDEEMRREQFARLWQVCGRYLIGASLLIVIGTVGYVWWKNHTQTTNTANTGILFNASQQMESGDSAKVPAELETLSKSGKPYAPLAALAIGESYVHKKDWVKADAIYKEIIDKEKAGSVTHDLAVLLSVFAQSQMNADHAKLVSQLEPLSEAGRPFSYTATEMLATLQSGDKAKSQSLIEKLVDDRSSPITLRTRAMELKTPAPAPTEPKKP